jgi:hypothetical protein
MSRLSKLVTPNALSGKPSHPNITRWTISKRWEPYNFLSGKAGTNSHRHNRIPPSVHYLVHHNYCSIRIKGHRLHIPPICIDVPNSGPKNLRRFKLAIRHLSKFPSCSNLVCSWRGARITYASLREWAERVGCDACKEDCWLDDALLGK